MKEVSGETYEIDNEIPTNESGTTSTFIYLFVCVLLITCSPKQ